MKSPYYMLLITGLLLATNSFGQKLKYKTTSHVMFVTDTTNVMAGIITVPKGSNVILSDYNGRYFKIKFKTDSGFVSKDEFKSTDKEIARLMLPH